jgi:transcriptional regulator with XRE-family HTH domain
MTAVTELALSDHDAVRRRELAAFLRSRRERITPEQVGLRPSRRRRTPGLRREEVAQLAGVGVTWYTWIEQGRDVHASVQVLEAIARTLLFDAQERAHLFTLAGAADTTIETDLTSLPPSAQLLLDRLEPYPGVIVNGRYDLLAWNRIWASAFPMLDELPPEDRNALWLIFTHPHWKQVLPDWDAAASRMVAQFRVAMAEHVAEPAWKALVARLQCSSAEFGEVWARHDVQETENRIKIFRHPTAGLLKLDYTYLWLGRRLGTRIVTYTPADAETAARLDQLHRSLSALDAA